MKVKIFDSPSINDRWNIEFFCLCACVCLSAINVIIEELHLLHCFSSGKWFISRRQVTSVIQQQQPWP